MSFVVCRMMKMNSSALNGIQFHNQRERESRTNPDIDHERSVMNYDLVNEEPIKYHKRVREIIDEQKTDIRKIRKDAVLINEFVITSDKGFFDELSLSNMDRFFENSLEFFKERYGQQNINHAVVHLDEHTPHMHLGVVPMRDGKLQSKNIFNRKELLYLQEELPKFLKTKGFEIERGEKGSQAEALTTAQYKIQERKKEIEALENQKENLLKQVEPIKLDDLEVKESGLFGSKTVRMPSESFEKLKQLAEVSETLKTQNKSILGSAKMLIEENKRLASKVSELQKENRGLRGYVQELLGDLKKVRGKLNLHETFYNWMKERMPGAKKFIDLFNKEQEQKQKVIKKSRDQGMER